MIKSTIVILSAVTLLSAVVSAADYSWISVNDVDSNDASVVKVSDVTPCKIKESSGYVAGYVKDKKCLANYLWKNYESEDYEVAKLADKNKKVSQVLTLRGVSSSDVDEYSKTYSLLSIGKTSDGKSGCVCTAKGMTGTIITGNACFVYKTGRVDDGQIRNVTIQ